MSKDFKLKFRVSVSTYELVKLALIHLEDSCSESSLFVMRASIVRTICLLQKALHNIDMFLDSVNLDSSKHENR